MDERTLTTLLEGVVSPLGLGIDAIEVVPAGKRSVLRIVVDGDGPKGSGPTMDEIADATRAISTALDESNADGNQPYTLEVSSRGTSRPLTKPAHFRRNRTRLVKLTLDGGETLTGRITDASDDDVTVDVDGTKRTIELATITKALVQIEMNRPAGLDDDDDDDDLEEDED